jgi:diguanylate cyclase (GGDEF)-like protein
LRGQEAASGLCVGDVFAVRQVLDSLIETRSQPLPDEPYARQLARGYRGLQFDAPLEAEYRALVGEEQRLPVLVCAWVALIIWSGFAAFDFVRLDLPARTGMAPDIWLLLAARWSVMLILVGYVLLPIRNRFPVGVAGFTFYVAIGLAVATTSVIFKANGVMAADTAQIVVVMAAFLPIGVTFYVALIAALSLVLATAVAGLIYLPGPQLTGHMGLTLVMAMALPVAAVGAYLREYAHRRQFLLGALLARQAQFDPLTDLANRRLFQRHATTTIAHAHRTDEPLVLAILDLDHFKQVNDRHGHMAGDDALQQVAEIIRDAARGPLDMAARLGGEEFALLLYGCDMQRARPILETMRLRIGSLPTPPGGEPLSISIGASMPREGEGLSALYARADRLLYASKSDGRNRLSVDS